MDGDLQEGECVSTCDDTLWGHTGGRRDAAVVRALTFHHGSPGLYHGPSVTCG